MIFKISTPFRITDDLQENGDLEDTGDLQDTDVHQDNGCFFFYYYTDGFQDAFVSFFSRNSVKIQLVQFFVDIVEISTEINDIVEYTVESFFILKITIFSVYVSETNTPKTANAIQ